MAKQRVPQFGSVGKYVTVETDATVGAVLGVNLRNPDGSLVAASQFGASPPAAGQTFVFWRTIQEIPANVSAIANQGGTGLYVITASGDSATRSIQPASGETTVTNGSGIAGNPTIGLADVADSGAGTLQKTQFDAKGRKTGTAPATTDDLTQGATNKYFVDAPSNGTTYGRKDGSWVGVPVGTVTSVGVNVPNGFEVSGSPVTSSGTIAIAYASGYQGYTTTEATKLAGIQSGAQQNVGTNLAQGTRTATTVPVTSSTGSSATLAAATSSLAGVMSAADKTKLDGISPSSYVTSVSAAPSSGITVDNSNPQAPVVGYTASLATNRLPKYTLSAANALTGLAGGEMVLITNLSDGSTTVPEPCWYDDTVASGTKWRRFSDRSIAD